MGMPISQVLVNQLITGNGGHTFTLIDNGTNLLVDGKAVLIPMAGISYTGGVSTVVAGVTPQQLEKFAFMDASLQTIVYNYVNAAVATAISGANTQVLNTFNTANWQGPLFVTAPGGDLGTISLPSAITYGSAVVAAAVGQK